MEINNYLKIKDKTIHIQDKFNINNNNKCDLYQECYNKITTILDYFDSITNIHDDIFLNTIKKFILGEQLHPSFSNQHNSYFIKNNQIMIWINNQNIYLYLHLEIHSEIVDYWFKSEKVFVLNGLYDLGIAQNVRRELLLGVKNFL